MNASQSGRKAMKVEPSVGQIYEEVYLVNGVNHANRYIRVDEIIGGYARCTVVVRASDGSWRPLQCGKKHRRTKIRIDRLRPTSRGWELVQDVTASDRRSAPWK